MRFMTVNSIEYMEAKIFGKYLIGRNIDNTACVLFSKAIEKCELNCVGKDRKIECFILHYPFWIGFIDAALTLTGKQSVFRKKIFIMLAVLESLPEYSMYFLPNKFSFFYVFKIIFVAFRCIYRFLIGFIILKFFRKA
jgi:hypothetical protein